MTLFNLGSGKYSLAQSSDKDGVPCLTLRKLSAPVEPGTLLKSETPQLEDFELVIYVRTPEAATSLLVVAQQIAFCHGVNQ
jgi:hypothetical protein